MLRTLYVYIFAIVTLISIGCSDTPYTGSMLTPVDVDRYIIRPEPGKICLQNAVDSVCLEFTQGKKRTRIYIHPESIVYTFYYENTIVLRAETVGEVSDARGATPENRDAVTDADQNIGGSGASNDTDAGNSQDTPDSDTGTDAPGVEGGDPPDTPVVFDGFGIRPRTTGWSVWIYYREGIPVDATPSLEGSVFMITVLDADGVDITDTVKGVELISSADGEALRFFVPSTKERITVRVKDLIETHRVTTFIVDTDGNVYSDEPR